MLHYEWVWSIFRAVEMINDFELSNKGTEKN